MKTSFFRCCAAATLLSFCLSFAFAAAEDLASIVNRAKERSAAQAGELRDLTITQTTRVMSRQNETAGRTAVMVIYKKGDLLRIETSPAETAGQQQKGFPPESGNSIVIYDGKNTWKINPLFGKTKTANDDPAVLRLRQDWWDALPKDAQLTGTDVIDGRPAYVIASRNKTAAFSRLWLDRDRLLPLQTEIVRDNVTIRTLFSDYRSVRNITELPYRIDVFQDNAPVSVSTVSSVEINTGLPDTLFDAGAVKTKGSSSEDPLKGAPQEQ